MTVAINIDVGESSVMKNSIIGNVQYDGLNKKNRPVCYDQLTIPHLDGDLMLKILGTIAIIVFMVLPAAIILAGQFNFLSGRRPSNLGAKNGMLSPPRENAWNVVSSQATRHPHIAYHVIAPLTYTGDGKAAFARLTSIVREINGATVVDALPNYLHAEFQTTLLKFVDDVEFVLDEPDGVIHMRSASRLGRKDFGSNRARLEAIRAQFNR